VSLSLLLEIGITILILLMIHTKSSY